jgi:hypothetical protein
VEMSSDSIAAKIEVLIYKKEIRKYYISKYPLNGIDENFLLELLHTRLTYLCIRGKHYKKASYHSKKLNKYSI